MEKASNICCVASSFSWSDAGGWLALKNYLTEDSAGNCCRGDTVTLDATDNLVFCENPEETVVLVGVKDLVVVRSGSMTLITHKDRAEDVKKIVKHMRKK
jgi:mannose-1-phosphate guanylyltransferase